MNPPGPQGPLSPPTSVNEWSVPDRPASRGGPQNTPYPPNKYQQRPPPSHGGAAEFGRRNLATPPVSGNMNGYAYGPPPSPGGPNSRPPPSRGGPPGSGHGGPPDHYRGNPSPPSSVAARSSSGTQVSVEAARRKQEMIESMLAQSHGVLRRHLAGIAGGPVGPDGQGRPGRRPNKARHKLVQLTPMQFQELSKDVCDELLRRKRYEHWQKAANGGGPPPPGPEPPRYLPPVEDIHPKRNQARQTLSELPDERFMTLATDTFFEIERRVPRILAGDIGRGGSPANRGPPSRNGGPPGMRPPPRQNSLGGQVLAGGMDEFGRPLPKSSQANTMVPNKSYLVEDDDDGDAESMYGISRRDTGATARSSASQHKALTEAHEKMGALETRMGDMERQLQERDETIQRLEEAQRDHESASREHQRGAQEFSSLRSDLEAKLADAQALNDNLQNELDRLHEQHSAREHDLTRQIGILTSQSSDADGEWRARHDELQAGHEELQAGHEELRARHGDLEYENGALQRELDEQRHATDTVRHELDGFVAEVKQLAARSDEGWQREDALRRQVRALETELQAQQKRSANDPAVRPPDPDQDQFMRLDGAVSAAHVAAFQSAVDGLLRAAHTPEPKGLLAHVKAVVVAVKGVDVDAARVGGGSAAKPRARVSATANNLVTAAQNFAYAPRVSPVSLLDASASHLAAAIVGLVATVGVHPEGEHDEHVPAPTPQATTAQPSNHVAPADAKASSVRAPTATSNEYDDDDDDDDESGFDMGAYGAEPADRESRYTNGDGGRSSMSDSVYSIAMAVPASHGRITSKTGAAHHGRGASSASAANGRAGGAAGGAAGVGYDLREQDEDIAELKHFLDEQSASLTESIQALVTAIRSGAPPPAITASVGRISDAAAHILRTMQDSLDDAGHASSGALRDAVEPQIAALANGKARLLAAEDEARDARHEGEWRDMVQGWPPVAFEIARALRELGGRLDEIAGGAGDDFR